MNEVVDEQAIKANENAVGIFSKGDELVESFVKFIYSEKATKFCKIFPLLLTVCTVVKSKGKILQTFVAFSEYMNFSNWSFFKL